MEAYRVDDWHRLVSCIVQVRHNGAVIRVGRVETATADGQILWLAPEGVDGRVLIEKSEGYEIWLEALDFDHGPLLLLR